MRIVAAGWSAGSGKAPRTVNVIVYAAEPAWEDKAKALASRLGFAFASSEQAEAFAGLALQLSADGLALERGQMQLRGDFSRMARRTAPGKLQRELLVRAVRIKGFDGQPRAIDATAGLGEDAFLLAAAGFSVCLIERNPLIAALLADTLARARADRATSEIASRMQLVEGDAVACLPQHAGKVEVVLLDPMFPEKGHSSSSKKKLQILQMLEQPCSDEAALLDAALGVRPRKVVVKRPLKGPHLAGRKPGYALAGKTVRFDCYLPDSLSSTPEMS